MFYVYVLRSKNNKNIVYKGYTTDLVQRLQRHNAGENISTKKHRPWMVIFYAAFEDKLLAMRFERYLKTGSGIAFMRKRLIDL